MTRQSTLYLFKHAEKQSERRLLYPEIVHLSLLAQYLQLHSSSGYSFRTRERQVLSRRFQHFPPHPTITLDIFSSASGIELLELGNADSAAASAGNTWNRLESEVSFHRCAVSHFHRSFNQQPAVITSTDIESLSSGRYSKDSHHYFSFIHRAARWKHVRVSSFRSVGSSFPIRQTGVRAEIAVLGRYVLKYVVN